jgi:hypothetical protein
LVWFHSKSRVFETVPISSTQKREFIQPPHNAKHLRGYRSTGNKDLAINEIPGKAA